MLPMDYLSPPPPLHSFAFDSTVHSTPQNIHHSKDHVLNMSPRPSHHLPNPVTKHMERISIGKSSVCWDSENETCFESITSFLSDGTPKSKSSAELVKEIATLELEILHLERYLLSLYRTAFHQHVLRKRGTHAQETVGSPAQATADQSSPRNELDMSEDYADYSSLMTPSSSLSRSNDTFQATTLKSFSRKEGKNAGSRHRSLADHLVNSCIDDASLHPDRLSEEIIRCISLIYCKLSSSTAIDKGNSVSSASSFCSSSTFSPRNLSGSWSPQCNDEVIERCGFEDIKQESGPYASMIEVLKICLDDETYNYAAMMLQKFRSLVKSLEKVDPKKMKREEKLAFWINIHNALVMHAYLAYGTQNYIKCNSIMKAAYNVGGCCINAYVIQSSILGIRPHYSAPWLQTLLSPGKKLKAASSKHPFAIEYPEPLVHFALCSGAYSDPAVRVYTANNVFRDLKVVKEEYIQATVYVHKETKIYLPKILCYYAKDISVSMGELLEAVSGCVSGVQQKAIKACVKGRPEKYLYWLEQSSSFRYLIHKEVVQGRWNT